MIYFGISSRSSRRNIDVSRYAYIHTRTLASLHLPRVRLRARAGSHWLSDATNERILLPFISRVASAELSGAREGEARPRARACRVLCVSRLNSDRSAVLVIRARARSPVTGSALNPNSELFDPKLDVVCILQYTSPRFITQVICFPSSKSLFLNRFIQIALSIINLISFSRERAICLIIISHL